jgi:glutamate racemase
VIGVFDSGVGGLSVWREMAALMPREPVLYLADQAHVPYGSRSLADVRALTTRCIAWLIERGCKMVVIACNTASAAALHHARAVFPAIPFVGMEPAVKPAASHTHTGVIGVLATQATFQGELFASVVMRFAAGARVIQQPCPGWVELVEGLHSTEHGFQHPALSTQHPLIDQYVVPLLDAGADSLVLGCTHFPFLAPAIQDTIHRWKAGCPAAAYEVELIDPSPAVARQAMRVRDQAGLACAQDCEAPHQFWTTGDVAAFRALAPRLLSGHPALLTASFEHADLFQTAPAPNPI